MVKIAAIPDSIKIKLEVDTTEVDNALYKVNALKDLLSRESYLTILTFQDFILQSPNGVHDRDIFEEMAKGHNFVIYDKHQKHYFSVEGLDKLLKSTSKFIT